jgi:hypothetical protein
MAAWDTDLRVYTLPDSLEDIGETISGTMTGLQSLGFGTQNTPGQNWILAGKDNGGTVVFISFWFLGERNFGQTVSCYGASATTGSEAQAIVSSVINAINFPSL